MKLFLRFLGVALVLIFLACLALAAPSYWQQYRVLKMWPAVQGEVISSQVTRRGDLFATDLQFAYVVDGRAYLGGYEFPHLSTHPEHKQKQAAQYPVGSRHSIRYNPADPSDIRIHVGYNAEFFVVPVFMTGLGLIFGVPGLVLLLFAWHRSRRDTAANVPVIRSGEKLWAK